MTARWDRIEALFHAVIDLPESERRAYIEDHADDVEMADEVRRLVGEHLSDPEFLEDAPSLPPTAAPERVGAYELVELLGEGGMGLVYLAKQAQPERLVALKLIRPGFVTEDAARRLAAEAEILGRLDHPGIARIYEAGTADVHGRSQPFFAMERVIGRDLVTHADERALPVRERLMLLADVADAVEDAHRQGIVHRDLKPANVLVDTEGRPRVLDFGIARLAQPDARLATLTDRGRLLGTLPYMSPEQLAGDDTVDPRVDVYALGVMMYELLGGRRPHPLEDTTLPEAIRIVAETDAPLLGSIDRHLRGDLETVTRTALAREPARRYASAGALADDLRRFLADKPIHARRPTATYRLRKLAKRRRMPLLVASATLVALIAVGGALVAQARAGRERDAQIAAINGVVAELIDFMENDVAGIDPELVTRIDEVAAAASEAYVDQPLGEAQVRETLGDAYYRLGRRTDALAQYERSVDLREDALGRSHPDTLDALNGVALSWLGTPGDHPIEDTLREIAAGRDAALGPNARKTLKSRNDLGMFLINHGHGEEGEQLLRSTLERQREHIGADHTDTLTTMQNLGVHLREVGRLEEAEPLARASVDIFVRMYGEREPRTLLSIGNLAKLLRDLERFDEAEPLYVRYVSGLERLRGSDHPDALVATSNYGSFLIRAGQVQAGLDAISGAIERASASLGPDDSVTCRIRVTLGRRLTEQRRFDDAEATLDDAHERLERVYGSDHPGTRRAARERRRLAGARRE